MILLCVYLIIYVPFHVLVHYNLGKKRYQQLKHLTVCVWVCARVCVLFTNFKLENAHSCMHVYLLRSKRKTIYMNYFSIFKLNSLLCRKRDPTWFIVATKGNPINEEPRGNRTRTTTNIGRALKKKMIL